MKKLQILLTALILLTTNGALDAQEKQSTQKNYSIILPEAQQAPKIDGQLTDPCRAECCKSETCKLAGNRTAQSINRSVYDVRYQCTIHRVCLSRTKARKAGSNPKQ